VLTNESENTLGEGESAGVQQKAQAVGSMFESEHMEHGEQEACLGDGTQTGACWVLISDGLQRHWLHTWRRGNNNQFGVNKIYCTKKV